ncbi:unnamed protein product [Paramecium sonneborni]|uniref:Phosphatase 2A Regulatory Subunit A helical domain-containing protein n=1 Tax=Paramecium sonneborni TaxID=65129 RepID=A0A8S1RKN4_9CILI|nr:unnamed protein product [Paramecium sonneborni]
MKKTFLTCLPLNTIQEQALFYTLRILRKASDQQLLELDQIKLFIKEISPLVLHHNRWVRDEAQHFITIQLKTFNSLDIYLHILPHIKKYLKENVPNLDEEIFKNLVQKPISQKFWQENHQFEKLYKFKQTLIQLEKLCRGVYIESKPYSEISIQKTDKIQNLPSSNVSQKLFEFFEAYFKLKFFKQNAYIILTEFIKKQKTWNDFNNFSKINLGIDLQNYKNYKNFKNKFVEQQQFKSSTQRINFISFNIIMNQFIQKSYQIQQTEIQYEKSVEQKIVKQFKLKKQLVTTIPEHKDIVTSLQKYSDQNRFISASYDGTIRFYEMNKIQEDFTCGSLHSIQIMDDQNKLERLNTIYVLEGADSFIVGTNSGQVSQYKNQVKVTPFTKDDSGIKKIVDYDNAFCHVTEKGFLILEDIRTRRTQQLSVNTKCLLAPSLVHDNNNTMLSTVNGFLILYDNR